MRTVALNNSTFQLLKTLKEKKKAKSFDELIAGIISKEENVPESMFGFVKGKGTSFTKKERLEMWNEKKRGL